MTKVDQVGGVGCSISDDIYSKKDIFGSDSYYLLEISAVPVS